MISNSPKDSKLWETNIHTFAKVFQLEQVESALSIAKMMNAEMAEDFAKLKTTYVQLKKSTDLKKVRHLEQAELTRQRFKNYKTRCMILRSWRAAQKVEWCEE